MFQKLVLSNLLVNPRTTASLSVRRITTFFEPTQHQALVGVQLRTKWDNNNNNKQNLFNVNNQSSKKNCVVHTTRVIVPSTTIPSSFRSYARRSTRTRVEEVETQQQTRQQTETELQQQQGTTPWGQQQQQTQEDSYQETTEQSLTEDIKKHMVKVYGTIMAGLGLTTLGTLTSMLLPAAIAPLAFAMGSIGSIIGVIAFVFTDKQKIAFRQNLFLTICGLTGFAIAPVVAASAPGVLFAATLGTSAIFGGFTLAALKAKRKSMLMMGGVLGGGLMLVFTCGLASIFLPMFGVTNPAILGALYNINLYLGLGVFSLFVAYDTQRMIEDYRAGDNDHVSPALGLFLDIINIFIRLLRIFGGRD